MPTFLQADEQGIAKAAGLIISGNLVVIPTETVYGLGSNALDPTAVSEIFRLKGRPSTNPVIIHVSSFEAVDRVAATNSVAEQLASEFWPGPLTLVLPALPAVPSIVTAGGPTVGVRMPDHAVALALLKLCDLPVAAPSANKSEEISPTTPQAVIRSLGESAPPILDGGACRVGIESTVLDISSDVPRILRPGSITRTQIEKALGRRIEVGPISGPHRSPGQMPRHYAPKTPAALSELPTEINENARPMKTAYLYFSDSNTWRNVVQLAIRLPDNAAGYAAGLYAALRQLDDSGADQILIEKPPQTDEWTAVWDRLTRATTKAR
jgi:L-threonylcarbamoyladenylate synthase